MGALSVLAGVLALLATPAGVAAQTTERVSVDSAGNQGDRPSMMPALSADGRFVAFASSATNLVPGDTNGVSDVFVHDRLTGTTERVSADSAGTQANSYSNYPALSADGRFVAFASSATNLVPGDTNGVSDVFVHDRLTGTTERVSVDSAGNEGNSYSLYPALSADGRFVAFASNATNLVPGDTNGQDDVFVHDRQTGTTERVSVDSAGNQANALFGSFVDALSADGRFVAFTSDATNLVPGDTNKESGAFGPYPARDVFVHDRQTRTTERVSVASDGTQGNSGSAGAALSADGRLVAFGSRANNLVPGGTNGNDVFVHDRRTRTTERVSVDSAPGGYYASLGYHPALSADGRFVAFESSATNLVAGDTNGVSDVFVHDRGAQDRVATTVNFDTPAPSGGPGPLDGVFEGIDFGVGEWAWEGPFNVAPTNHVYFANSTGTSRTFAFAPAPRVLESLSMFSPSPGTLTLSDDTGQTLTREVTTGSMQRVTTGWTRATATVTVSFTNGWDLGIDDITSSAAP